MNAVMNPEEVSVRSLLVQLQGGRLLVPNTALAEVTGYSEPIPVKGSPEWFLGMVSWRGMLVPLVSFERLIGDLSYQSEPRRRRVAIFNTVNGNRNVPFVAVVSQGIPRLLQIRGDALSDGPAEQLPGVLRQVVLEGQPAFIPDIDQIESSLARFGVELRRGQ